MPDTCANNAQLRADSLTSTASWLGGGGPSTGPAGARGQDAGSAGEPVPGPGTGGGGSAGPRRPPWPDPHRHGERLARRCPRVATQLRRRRPRQDRRCRAVAQRQRSRPVRKRGRGRNRGRGLGRCRGRCRLSWQGPRRRAPSPGPPVIRQQRAAHHAGGGVVGVGVWQAGQVFMVGASLGVDPMVTHSHGPGLRVCPNRPPDGTPDVRVVAGPRLVLTGRGGIAHSHSMVPGGLEVMS